MSCAAYNTHNLCRGGPTCVRACVCQPGQPKRFAVSGMPGGRGEAVLREEMIVRSNQGRNCLFEQVTDLVGFVVRLLTKNSPIQKSAQWNSYVAYTQHIIM